MLQTISLALSGLSMRQRAEEFYFVTYCLLKDLIIPSQTMGFVTDTLSMSDRIFCHSFFVKFWQHHFLMWQIGFLSFKTFRIIIIEDGQIEDLLRLSIMLFKFNMYVPNNFLEPAFVFKQIVDIMNMGVKKFKFCNNKI